VKFLDSVWRRLSARRKSLQWLERQPATHVISFIELAAIAGKWLARLHGAGLAASMAFIIAAYTSLTTASDHICIAAFFVSQTIEGGRFFASIFVIGGACALPAASMPNSVRFVRNFMGDRKNSQNRVDNGSELEGLVNKVAWIIFILQTLLIFISAWLGVIFIMSILSPKFIKQSDILVAWSEADQSCRPPTPLRMLPIPNLDLQHWPAPN